MLDRTNGQAPPPSQATLIGTDSDNRVKPRVLRKSADVVRIPKQAKSQRSKANLVGAAPRRQVRTIGTAGEPRTQHRKTPSTSQAGRSAAYRREQEVLLRDAADYQTIFDNAIVGICFSINRRIVRCNRRFEEMFGYKPGELDGRLFVDIYPSEKGYRQRGRAIYDHFLTHRMYADERLMKRKDGELFWCAVSGKRLDSDRYSRRAVWILQDISSRKHAEEALLKTHQRLEKLVEERTLKVRTKNEALQTEIARRRGIEEKLRESRKKYRALFEVSPMGMFVTDTAGSVVEVNKAMARLIPKAELSACLHGSGSAKRSFVHSDGTPMQRGEFADVRALREGKAIPEFELGIRHPAGETRWFSVASAPIPVKALGAVVVHTDITQRKHLEGQERLQRLELNRASRLNLMGEMGAAIAHELGQPLSSAVNFLSGCRLRLDAGEYDRDAVYGTITEALHHVEQAGDIVKHIRQFVRRHEPNKVVCDLDAIIRDTLRFMDIERRQHAAVITLRQDQALPPVMMDPLEIKQVLANLIKNGLEAMATVPEPERSLVISTRIKGSKWIEISVADRGPGVSTANRHNIFNPFFSTKANGMGLGLAICRSIVESHGGALTVGACSQGGAVFKITIPCEVA